MNSTLSKEHQPSTKKDNMSLIFWIIIELLFLFDKAPKYAFIKSDTTFYFLLWISKTLSRGVMPLPKSINQSVRKVSLVIDVLNQANILIEHSKSKLLRGHFYTYYQPMEKNLHILTISSSRPRLFRVQEWCRIPHMRHLPGLPWELSLDQWTTGHDANIYVQIHGVTLYSQHC